MTLRSQDERHQTRGQATQSSLAPCWRRSLLLVLAITIVVSPKDALGQADYKQFAPDQWRNELANNEYAVIRRRAAYVLGRMDTGDKPADAAALAEALKDRDLVVRWYAADSLGRIGPSASGAIPKMTLGLTDPTNDKDVRRNLARAFGRIGEADDAAVKKLSDAAKSDDLLLACAAAETLVILKKVDEAYPRLLAIVSADDPIAVFAALQSLERLSKIKAPPLDKVSTMLGHANADVRRAAARVVGGQGWSAVETILEQLDRGGDKTACLAALRYASQDPPKASQIATQHKAVERVWPMISRDEPGVASGALAFLARQGVVTLTTLWSSWNGEDQVWKERAGATVEKWFSINGDLIKQPALWTKSDESLRQESERAIASNDAPRRRLGLWLLAELPLDLNSIDDMAVREALRDADVFNRRNAASILRKRSDNPQCDPENETK